VKLPRTGMRNLTARNSTIASKCALAVLCLLLALAILFPPCYLPSSDLPDPQHGWRFAFLLHRQPGEFWDIGLLISEILSLGFLVLILVQAMIDQKQSRRAHPYEQLLTARSRPSANASST